MARGRPRAFDTEVALDRALDLFWRKGYEATSLSDLTEAMGINRPSLYAAFGDKKALFLKVLDRYLACPAAGMADAVEGSASAREAVRTLLYRVAESAESTDKPTGCLLVHGALCGDGEVGEVQAELARRRAAGEVALRCRLDRARQAGEIPPDTDIAALAKFFSSVQQGMAVQARSGASAAELRAVADQAMAAWPGKTAGPAEKT